MSKALVNNRAPPALSPLGGGNSGSKRARNGGTRRRLKGMEAILEESG